MNNTFTTQLNPPTRYQHFRNHVFTAIFSLLLFSAATGQYETKQHSERVPFPFPFEQLSANRQIVFTIILITAILTSATIRLKKPLRPLQLSHLELALITTHSLISLKLLVNSSVPLEICLANMLIWGAIWYVRYFGIVRWFTDAETCSTKVLQSITVASILLSASSIYLMYTSPSSAIAGNSGRLNGITANPQFLGLATAISLAAPIHLLNTSSRSNLLYKGVLISTLIAGIFVIAKTGSRTAAISLAICLLSGLSNINAALIMTVAILAICVSNINLQQTELDHLLRTTDTRSVQWQRGLEFIDANFLFGGHLANRNFAIVENSWISIFCVTGFVGGIIPFSLALFSTANNTLRFILRLSSTRKKHSYSGVFLGLILGSIFEAYFVATISMSMLLILLYGLLTKLEDESNAGPLSYS